MQLYWPHLKAVTRTTATILEQSKIVALECAALYVAQIDGATHSSATILDCSNIVAVVCVTAFK